MEKSPEAFRTISEVADWLGVPTHVLRFWESRFSQVKPVKRAGGRRYYRPADMLLLGGIKRLLHDDGMTIRGVQKLLREEGVRHIATFSQPLDSDYPMKDVSPEDTLEAEVPPSPMAEDVEPEPIDNVVPLGTAAADPTEDAEEVAELEPLDLVDEEALSADGAADDTAPDDRTDEAEAPEFAFLRRPESTPDVAPEPAEPDAAAAAAPSDEAPMPGLFASRRAVPPPPASEPEAAPAEASATPAPPAPAIPATPDVPATDPSDDDPASPAIPAIAARLARGHLAPARLDPAVIAQAVADLRAIRARL
jgi:DNA-binding transcriptional MerR regulator